VIPLFNYYYLKPVKNDNVPTVTVYRTITGWTNHASPGNFAYPKN